MIFEVVLCPNDIRKWMKKFHFKLILSNVQNNHLKNEFIFKLLLQNTIDYLRG